MKRSSRRAVVRVNPRRESRQERLIRALVEGCNRPADVLELCYWSREPGMVEIVRAIAAMPEDARGVFEAFVALARDAKSIKATLDPRGVLTLASPDASTTLALAQYAAETDNEDATLRLN